MLKVENGVVKTRVGKGTVIMETYTGLSEAEKIIAEGEPVQDGKWIRVDGYLFLGTLDKPKAEPTKKVK